jgi:hypothetical protein
MLILQDIKHLSDLDIDGKNNSAAVGVQLLLSLIELFLLGHIKTQITWIRKFPFF